MARLRDSLQTSVVQGRRQGLRTGFLLVWIVVAAALFPPVRRLPVFQVPQNWAYDMAFQRRLTLDPGDLVILAIDERSTLPQHLGRFPWSRRVYARVLDSLSQARVVGLDVLFSEPEGDGQADRLFADALQRHGRCVLAFHVARDAEVGSARPHLPPPLPLSQPPRRPWVVRQVQVQPPIPVLARAAAGLGFADLRADWDGIYRRAPLIMGDDQGQLYPHFALQVARVASGIAPGEIGRALSASRARLGADVPLSPSAEALINYCGPAGTVPTVPFCDLYEGRVKPERFADKVVIIGATAAGLHDLRPSPFAQREHFFLGVETNASLCRTLISGPGLKDASEAPAWLLAGGLFAMASVALVWLLREPIGGLVAGLLLLGIEGVGFFAAFYGACLVLPFGPVALATVLGLAWSAWRRVGLERNVVRNQFAVYVSPHVLAELMRNPEVLFTGERREVTLLFADIRGSTTLAEKVPAERWLAQLNEYLTAMSEVILVHEGYLDKFMGDGIMAVWNTFGNQPHHRDLALMAAISMLQRLDALNDQWSGRGDREVIRIGVGLHSGEAVVGNVGSRQRTQFTAIGDPVNAASRIESATKEFGVRLAISQAVVEGLVRDYALTPLGKVALRGKMEPVTLYTLRAAKEVATDAVAPEKEEAPDRAGTDGADAPGDSGRPKA